MDFLLAQGITETIEVQKKSEDPTGGGVKEEITIPVPSNPPIIRELDSYSRPLMPVPRLPMGTITETITIPAPRLPLGTTPIIPEARINPVRKVSAPATQKKELSYEEKYGAGSTEEIKQEPNGQITIKREICDGEVHLGPFKSCLKEFTGVPAVGWIAAAAGLIVLWKWLDYRFRK
jgi:hypothetical protein